MTENSILNTIGNTPLVEIKHLSPNPQVKILAKLEYFNPGGSVKDRPALSMIQTGEKTGELTHQKIIIEATSGNTGIGLALVCAVKGYRLLLTMSEAVSAERRKILKARGADILLTPGHLGTDGAIEKVYRMARENPDKYFMTDQFNNPANWQIHYHTTAEEILMQTNGEISSLVATMGTSGTLMGMQRKLKEHNPMVRIVGVEPYLGHKIQGLKNMKEAYKPEIYDKNRLDQKINIDDEVAFEMTRQLARIEGLFVGMSSGAAMAIARAEAKNMTSGTIVVIFPDGGERYLSTPLFAVKQKVGIKLFNTLSRQKEPFVPITPGKTSVYSCGPTAHAEVGLGACRRFVFSDLLCRYLEYRGYAVTHVMNITDIDDKTIIGSEKVGQSLKKFTEKNIAAFKRDCKTLYIKPADRYPRASRHVDEMVELSQKMARKGFAYEKLRSLYFDISQSRDYGRLSGVDLNKIKLGATVDLDEYEKDNPRDFTLLKRSKLSELKQGIYTKTEWGNVRPSWHIQCAAISQKYFGETYDIHTSGRELIFPHHENVIAIARALNSKLPARFWLHCDPVLIDGKEGDPEKKEITVSDLIDLGYSGREVRYWLLFGHYRKPIDFSICRLENARSSLKRIDGCIHTLQNINSGEHYPELNQLLYNIKHSFNSAMDDDLNISAAMASIFKNIKKINIFIGKQGLHIEDAHKILDAFGSIDEVLSIFDFENTRYEPHIQQLIRQREKARSEQDWILADKIRDELRLHDISIQDKQSNKGKK